MEEKEKNRDRKTENVMGKDIQELKESGRIYILLLISLFILSLTTLMILIIFLLDMSGVLD